MLLSNNLVIVFKLFKYQKSLSHVQMTRAKARVRPLHGVFSSIDTSSLNDICWLSPSISGLFGITAQYDASFKWPNFYLGKILIVHLSFIHCLVSKSIKVTFRQPNPYHHQNNSHRLFIRYYFILLSDA